MNLYVHEKISELERELLTHRPRPERPRRRPVFGAAARLAGRTLRRLGEGLEGWAAPPHPTAGRGL